MSALKVLGLTYRLVKGSHLTHQEADKNLTVLKNFSEALAEILDSSLNPDGTIKAGSVLAGALGERVVGAANMAFPSALFAVDTGSVNKLVVAFDPAMEAYEDGTVLFIRVGDTNTGVTTLKVDALDAVQILKGTKPLAAGDIQKNTVIVVGYYGGNWQLAGAFASSSTDESAPQSIVYDSQDDLPGNGLTATFVHGLGIVPEHFAVYLRVKDIGGDAGYDFNERIPIGQAVDVGDLPAFSVTTSSANVEVTQNTAAVYVPDPATPGSTIKIDETKWEIEVVIRQEVSVSTMMAPPLTLQVVNPMGGVCHGNDLFALVAGGKSWVRIDLTTGVAVSTVNPAAAHTYASIGLFMSDDKHQVIYCGSAGIFRFDAAVPAVLTELGAHGNLSSYGPVEIDEDTAPAAAATPDVYAVEELKLTNVLTLRKLTTHGGAPAGNTLVGSSVSFHDAGITNSAAFNAIETVASRMRWMGYNPVKKRVYLITENSGLLHIFKITSPSLHEWWADAGRYAKCAYEKAIVLAGVPSNDAYYQYERMAVEFDLTTGQEKSVVFGRYPKANGMGTITRSPWVEG